MQVFRFTPRSVLPRFTLIAGDPKGGLTIDIERLHVTSQMLHNHFRVAKEVCQHTHSTRSVVGVDATKHVQLPISSEPTGSTMDQSCCAYNCTARVVGETWEGRNTVLSRS